MGGKLEGASCSLSLGEGCDDCDDCSEKVGRSDSAASDAAPAGDDIRGEGGHVDLRTKSLCSVIRVAY